MSNAEPPMPPLRQPPAARKRTRWWRWLLALLLTGLVGVLLLVAAFDGILRRVVRAQIEKSTGMKTELARLELRIVEPGVHVAGLRLINTPEFGGDTFLSLPEFTLALDRTALFERKKIHVRLVRLNLEDLHVVVNARGQTNVVELRNRAEHAKAAAGKPVRKGEGPQFDRLDRLELSLGKIRYSDLRDPDYNRVAPLNVTNIVVENCQSQEEIGPKLLVAALLKGVRVFDLLSGGIENLPRPESTK